MWPTPTSVSRHAAPFRQLPAVHRILTGQKRNTQLQVHMVLVVIFIQVWTVLIVHARFIQFAHLEGSYPILQGVILLHSRQSRDISIVTPTSLLSSLICCFHVFLGCPHSLIPGNAMFITLRVTLFSSCLCACLNNRVHYARSCRLGEVQ